MAIRGNAQKEEIPLQNNGDIFIHHSEAVWENRDTYGPPGFKGVFTNYYATLCAAFAAIGGLIFGYDQGVVSIVLVMPQFLARFARVSDSASGAGFWKGLLTAMIELGALLGALNQGVSLLLYYILPTPYPNLSSMPRSEADLFPIIVHVSNLTPEVNADSPIFSGLPTRSLGSIQFSSP